MFSCVCFSGVLFRVMNLVSQIIVDLVWGMFGMNWWFCE